MLVDIYSMLEDNIKNIKTVTAAKPVFIHEWSV